MRSAWSFTSLPVRPPTLTPIRPSQSRRDRPNSTSREPVRSASVWRYRRIRRAWEPPLLAAAAGLRRWIDAGGTRPPIRAALIRFWMKHRLLRAPVPLTGARALRADISWDAATWIPAFLTALAVEAEDALDLLFTMERAWFAARAAVAGRRRTSRAAAAVDILAAAPLVSATSLAAGLGMAVKNAAALLDAFCAAGIAVEVTHRSKRRLFGLAGLAPLREVLRP